MPTYTPGVCADSRIGTFDGAAVMVSVARPAGAPTMTTER
jgi:hypothetical protein